MRAARGRRVGRRGAREGARRRHGHHRVSGVRRNARSAAGEGRRGEGARRTRKVSERHSDSRSDDSAAGSSLRATLGHALSLACRAFVNSSPEVSEKIVCRNAGWGMRGNAGETSARAPRAMRVGYAPQRVRKCRERRFSNGSESCPAVRRRGGECVRNDNPVQAGTDFLSGKNGGRKIALFVVHVVFTRLNTL